MDADYGKMFAAIENEVCAAGKTQVRLLARICPQDYNGISGAFVPLKRPWSRIDVYRDFPNNDNRSVYEVITLAHECGHREAWLQEDEDEAVRSGAAHDSAAWLAMAITERTAMLRAEERAWRAARPLLERHSFADWSEFERRKRDDISTYRSRLGVENLAPP
ncbi:MAG: hypothetical protein IPK60_20960 [Sandaracinaceae bacterium]|nr:hypothetical protein [Sandaracinaceae bacterium]